MLPDTAIRALAATGSPRHPSSGAKVTRRLIARSGSSHTPGNTTDWYCFSAGEPMNTVVEVSTATEPETLGELIADCEEIPQSLQAEIRMSRPAAALPWAVDEVCHAQVAELDYYV
jgi:hypothetical protein